jgi:hypothetical protein
MGSLHEDHYQFMIISRSVLQIKCVEKIKTLILYSTSFLEDLDVYEIM